MSLNSALENKTYYTKDEALVRMMVLGVKMKVEKGSQYYCYRDGVFYSSATFDFKESREWNTNDSSPDADWMNIKGVR